MASRVQFRKDMLSGSGSLAFLSNTTSGGLIVVWYMGTNGLFGASASDGTNTYTTFHQESIGFGTTLYGLYAYNIAGGAVTVTCSGVANNVGIAIAEYSGIKSSADPLITNGGAQGTASPLQESLTFGVNCLLVNCWWNQALDDYTGLVSGTTLIDHSGNGFGAAFSTQAENLSATATTTNVGVTTGGNALNVQASGAFELASAPATNSNFIFFF